MHKTINIWLLIAVCACALVGFFWYSESLSGDLQEVEALYGESKLALSELQGEQAELKATLDAAGTDAFIENQARTIYDYMMPDEIRFVITNPEALYGDEEIPSR